MLVEPFGRKDVMRSNYESRARRDLGRELQVTKRNRKEFTVVTVRSFRSWALKLSEIFAERNGQKYSV